jgi:protein-arginine deiminase
MRHLWLLLVLPLGCNGPPPPIVDVVVDSNRSGLLEAADPTEDADENVWDAKHGAVFLANLDDDDMDGKPDAEDDKVNGANDIADLAPISLRGWPTASLKASGTFGIDAASAPNVRVFRVSGPRESADSYTAVADPTKIALTSAELVSGAEFAIEGKTFLKTRTGWNGKVQLSFTVTDETVKDPMHVALLNDEAVLRVAPVMFQFNTAPTEKLMHADAGRYTQTLVEGMTPMAAAAGNQPILALPLDELGLEVDVWAQDFIDFAYTSRPGPGGKPIGMKIAVRSAQPDRNAGEIGEKYFFGPDFATAFVHAEEQGSDHGYSMNSFGNWDVIPPYEKGADKYPVGRNLWGAVDGNPRISPDPDFQEFVRAQAVQPDINVDTSWLGVGHVDEFTSWVKSNSPRGWAMLRASPKDARTMLMGLDGQGMGATQMFVSKMTYDYQQRKYTSAAVAVTTVLGSANLMAANQTAQAKVDSETTKLINEIGLAANEVIEMPFLYERSFGGAGAFIPGTVNLLYADGAVLAPDPFGPMINGADPFKEIIKTSLGAIGLQVFFADDWDTFHEGGGEVHCGTNAIRDMNLKWWESGR